MERSSLPRSSSTIVLPGTFPIFIKLAYLFSRKKAFIGTDRFKDEVSRVMEMITKYAIQRPDVTFAFRTTSSSSFRTSATGDTKAVISSLLGKQFADNLIGISCESNILRYKISGYISKPISAATSRGIMDKKTKQRFFSLFVNGRSVECPKLKHAIDSSYSSRDVICMCTHLSLEIDPTRVDVNVHPTKQSVIFIGMDDVVDELQYKVLEILNECMEDENVSFNSSQPSTSNIQKASDLSASQILKQPTQLFMIPPVKKEKSKDRNSTGGNKFQQPSASPKNAAYFQNRTDSQERRLEQFFRIGDSASLNDENKDDNGVNLVEFTASNDDVESTQFTPNSSSIRTFRLKPLDFLKAKVENEISPTLIGFFKNHIFVGFISVGQCLFQFGTALYLINISEILEPFFYQISLSNFGNFVSYRIGEPGSVKIDALLKASGDDMWESTESINNAEKLLSDNAEMLNNYFSIDEISLVSIPCIMNGLQPQLERLPKFVSALLYVNYEDQASCFHEILMAIANFYVPKEEFCNGNKLSDLNSVNWKSMLRDKVLPYLKNRFKPPAILADKKVINPLVDAHDLYKVFERC
ncbi:hypothetical protein WR25_05709 [Diploscapter pachys]|uniref:DNA mismatch repair protein S5 domain-containing protein n=1 Tax=Diploscapter pachys TaxID=2018661 RepID=A0A2A2LSU7_9BILA|nr:hypothetical protein WR25_05709 [Diploscapter pachys]